MTGDQTATLAYLILLGLAIGGWTLAANRRNLGKLAQQAAVWTFIFLGAIVAVGLWTDIRNSVTPRQSVMLEGGRVEIPQSPDGHYYLTLTINDAPIRFVVDTGATDMVLSATDAARAGIDPDGLIFSGRAFTANGMVETAPVQLAEVGLGGVVDRNVRAVVNQGAMPDSLLGMAYLQRFDRLEISDRTLVLER